MHSLVPITFIDEYRSGINYEADYDSEVNALYSSNEVEHDSDGKEEFSETDLMYPVGENLPSGYFPGFQSVLP